MRTRKNTGVTVLTAGIALALGAVPLALVAPAIVAGGETTTLTPATAAYFPGPTLTLSTTTDRGSVTLSDSTLGQQFTGDKFCALAESGDNLLELDGRTEDSEGTVFEGSAGFREGSIGVYEGSDASQCFRVDAGSKTDDEVLRLALGSDLEGLLAKSASFDIEIKANDTLIVVTALGGTENAESFTVGTGKHRKTADVSSGARSGGHIRVIVPEMEGVYFDAVELKADEGKFTLEGGTDAGNDPSTISLVQPADATFCSDPDEANGETNFIEEFNTKVEYLGNAVSEPSCFGVQLTPGDDEVRFIYRRGSAPADAQFRYTIEWTVRNEGRTPEVTLPAAEIDFELPRPDIEGGFTTLPFCPDELYGEDRTEGPSLSETTLSYADFVEDDVNYRDFDTDDETDSAKQYACIDTRKETEVTVSEITITDTIFVVGDARMRL